MIKERGEMAVKYITIKKCDILNGPGVRISFWVSGCNHHCKNCHNPETHNPNVGKEFDKNTIIEILELLSEKYVSGITLTGGDPLFPGNRKDILKLCKAIRERFGNTKTIMVYSGYTYEELIKFDDALKVINIADILVDGKYVEELNTKKCRWRGSSNQRLIDLNKTRETGTLKTLEDNKYV